MSRLTYRGAIGWIEDHERGELDTPASDDELRDRPTVALVAFIYGHSVEQVVADVLSERARIQAAEERSMGDEDEAPGTGEGGDRG